jgi:hypothetical protein
LVWQPETGAEYYIQVVGDSTGDYGEYTLSVESVDDIVVLPVNNGAYLRAV